MKLNLGMAFALLMILFAFEPVHGQQHFPGMHVVLVVVKDVHKFESTDPNRQAAYDKLDPPLYEATLQVQEVLSGSEKLKGKECYALCRDKFLEGNSPVIIPALKVGEVAIFLVGGSDGKIYIASVCGIEGGEMPYIQGRNPDFVVILERLRRRRDHPEDSTAVDVKAKQIELAQQTALPLASSMPKTTPTVAGVPIATTSERAPYLILWLTGAVAVLMAGIFLLRRT